MPAQMVIPKVVSPQHPVHVLPVVPEIDSQPRHAEFILLVRQRHTTFRIGQVLAVVLERIAIGGAADEESRCFPADEKTAIGERRHEHGRRREVAKHVHDMRPYDTGPLANGGLADALGDKPFAEER